MVTAQVVGNDATIAYAASQGNFELLAMMPVIAYSLLQSLDIVSNVTRLLADKAISGCSVNRVGVTRSLEINPILATALAPIIGYEESAKIAKEAHLQRRPVKEIAAERTRLTRQQLDQLLDPEKLTTSSSPRAKLSRRSHARRKQVKR